jgi:anti-sigma regulatory factor (Ser/Thr protein kinase)
MAIDTLEQARKRARRIVLESRRLTSASSRLRDDSARACGQARKLRSSLPPSTGGEGTWIYDGDGRGRTTSLRHVVASLQGNVEAPGRARRVLAEHVRGRVPEDLLPTLELLVTELVTNGVLHGGANGNAAVMLHVHLHERLVRVQVTDPGGGFDPQSAFRTPGPDGGWGLLMVRQLSDAWGAAREAGRSRVWFRIRF